MLGDDVFGLERAVKYLKRVTLSGDLEECP
jgi:hypothetical protein